jgi:urease accessory protein UreF
MRIHWGSKKACASDLISRRGKFAHISGWIRWFLCNERSNCLICVSRSTPQKAGDLDALMSLDHEISAWKLVRETRDASVQLGRRRVSSLRVICTDSLLEGWAERIEQGRAAGHYLISADCGAAGRERSLVAALIRALLSGAQFHLRGPH